MIAEIYRRLMRIEEALASKKTKVRKKIKRKSLLLNPNPKRPAGNSMYFLA